MLNCFGGELSRKLFLTVYLKNDVRRGVESLVFNSRRQLFLYYFFCFIVFTI